MDFNAKQMREDALIKKGRYRFRVAQGKEKRSSSGNDMMILKITIDTGRATTIWATLIFIPKMFWMVEHFCEATGMAHKIEEGRLMAQDCDGKEGILEIDHRTNKETGEVEAYVKDFLIPEKQEPIQKDDGFMDDDIPNFA